MMQSLFRPIGQWMGKFLIATILLGIGYLVAFTLGLGIAAEKRESLSVPLRVDNSIHLPVFVFSILIQQLAVWNGISRLRGNWEKRWKRILFVPLAMFVSSAWLVSSAFLSISVEKYFSEDSLPEEYAPISIAIMAVGWVGGGALIFLLAKYMGYGLTKKNLSLNNKGEIL